MLGLPAGVHQAAKGVDGIETTTVEQAIERMLEGQRKAGILRDTKITWKRAYVKDNAGNIVGQIGQFNKYLPSMRIPGYSLTFSRWYWIQNSKIFKANGEPTSLEEILRLDPQAHDLVEKAYETFMKQALELDPNLCRHCRKYSAESVDDAQRHLINEHPDVAQAMLKPQAEPAVVAAVVAPPAETFKCDLCSKEFPKKQALVMHKRIGHKVVEKVI